MEDINPEHHWAFYRQLQIMKFCFQSMRKIYWVNAVLGVLSLQQNTWHVELKKGVFRLQPSVVQATRVGEPCLQRFALCTAQPGSSLLSSPGFADRHSTRGDALLKKLGVAFPQWLMTLNTFYVFIVHLHFFSWEFSAHINHHPFLIVLLSWCSAISVLYVFSTLVLCAMYNWRRFLPILRPPSSL